MPNCAILCCKNSTNNVSRDKGNVSFHQFPNNPYIKEKWIDATGNLNWFPTKHSRICSVHFDDECFTETDKCRRLTSKAIPTINVLRTSTNNQNIDEPPTSNEDTSLNAAKKTKLEHRLNLAQEKIKQQTLLIKRLREQDRRKGVKILKLVSIIETLKKKSFQSGE